MKNRILAYIVIIATVFQMFSGISPDFKSMNVMADENELSQPKMVDGTYQISSAKELMWAKENPGCHAKFFIIHRVNLYFHFL